jgi:hypothetical protein
MRPGYRDEYFVVTFWRGSQAHGLHGLTSAQWRGRTLGYAPARKGKMQLVVPIAGAAPRALLGVVRLEQILPLDWMRRCRGGPGLALARAAG